MSGGANNGVAQLGLKAHDNKCDMLQVRCLLQRGGGRGGKKKKKKEREYNNKKKLAPPHSHVGVWSQVNYRHQGLRRRAAELGGGGGEEEKKRLLV